MEVLKSKRLNYKEKNENNLWILRSKLIILYFQSIIQSEKINYNKIPNNSKVLLLSN